MSDRREQEALEMLLLHSFPLLGSLTPSWENWDNRIEYLLRINRSGRVLVEGNKVTPSLLSSLKNIRLNRDTDADTKNNETGYASDRSTTAGKEDKQRAENLMKTKIHISVWPQVLRRAFQTSPKGFLPPLEDATGLYYLIRHGPALSEIFAAATR